MFYYYLFTKIYNTKKNTKDNIKEHENKNDKEHINLSELKGKNTSSECNNIDTLIKNSFIDEDPFFFYIN